MGKTENMEKKADKTTENGKKKMGLSTKIFISLLAGAICGVLIHYYMPEGYFKDTILINGILYVLGNGFIRLMQIGRAHV